MKIKLIAERRTTTPHFSAILGGYVTNQFWAIIECWVDGEYVDNVTHLSIAHTGDIGVRYGQQRKSKPTVELEIGGEMEVYEFLSAESSMENNILKMEIEVKK